MKKLRVGVIYGGKSGEHEVSIPLFQPVAGRVARFLLEQTTPNQTTSPRHLTLDEIAAQIGSTREMVCRYLRSFSEAGLIDITRTEYQITDREGLQGISRQAKG